MSFLIYWFLRIEWLFAKSVEITKETAIHKNRFVRSFYGLVIEEGKLKVNFVMIC